MQEQLDVFDKLQGALLVGSVIGAAHPSVSVYKDKVP